MRLALPTFLQRDASFEAALPTFALPLWRLAYIALGDAASATALTSHVLAQKPQSEGAAVKLLIENIPEGWLNWPGATGPAEWLRLRLRREQTDRLLSIMGEWSALERIAVGLYLLWDVPRDDLDAWVSSEGMNATVAELMAHVGRSLNFIELPTFEPECAAFRPDLLEAYEQDASPALRRHLLGCYACRTEAAGLRRSKDLVHHALHVFFRQQPPDNLADRVIVHRRMTQQTINIPDGLVYVLIVAILILGLLLRPANAPPATAESQPLSNAADVIDRALDRFIEGPERGVFHERIRITSSEQEMIVERWFDHRQRLRVTMWDAGAEEPIFDLSSDGKSWISYQFTPRIGKPTEALLYPSNVPAMLPVLRQSPFVGSFGGMPVEQQVLDVALLGQARLAGAALLGSSEWKDRPAYLLSSIQDDGTRLLLLIDQSSSSLLRAQQVVPNTSIPRTVWEAESVEEGRSSPSNTFEPVSERVVHRTVNPRQILINRHATQLTDVVSIMKVPIPTSLPDQPISSQLLALDAPSMGVLQMYDSPWSTLAIMTPRLQYYRTPPEPPQDPFKRGRYTLYASSRQQATLIEFVVDGDPYRRSAAYLWHVLADDEERERMLLETLDSLEMVDQSNADRYTQRFGGETEIPSQTTTTRIQPSAAMLMFGQPVAPARRYLRAKIQQTSQ